MEDRSKTFGPFHDTIKTRLVFSESNQVFLKRDNQEPSLKEDHGDVWFPINFQWIPVLPW